METKPSSPELIEQERREKKNILIELSDEVLKLISEKELEEIEQSAEEFDGFTGMRVVGKLEEVAQDKISNHITSKTIENINYGYNLLQKAIEEYSNRNYGTFESDLNSARLTFDAVYAITKDLS